MASSVTSSPDLPMGELNTTPLIDVMLVLLVMFILSIPVATNSLIVDLPKPGPNLSRLRVLPENTLGVTNAGTLTWNQAALSESDLVTLLQAATQRSPQALIKFQPQAGAPYGSSARAIHLVKQSGATAFAFVGNEQFSDFGKPHR